LGFSYEEPNPERTIGGKFQAHLSFCPHINSTLHCFRFTEVHVAVHVKVKRVH
jgi:hypothetical protein